MPLSSTPPIEQKLPVFEPECLGLDLFILGDRVRRWTQDILAPRRLVFWWHRRSFRTIERGPRHVRKVSASLSLGLFRQDRLDHEM